MYSIEKENDQYNIYFRYSTSIQNKASKITKQILPLLNHLMPLFAFSFAIYSRLFVLAQAAVATTTLVAADAAAVAAAADAAAVAAVVWRRQQQ